VLLTFFITRDVLGQLGGEPREVDAIARAIAEGELNVRIDTGGKAMRGIFGSMMTMKRRLSEVVGSVRDAVGQITNSAGEIAAGTAELSSRIEQSASALEETSASLEELTSTIKQNADSADEANKLASGLAMRRRAA